MKNGRFRIAPSKHFLREFKKLPLNARTRIELAIDRVVSNPYAGVRLRL